MFALDVMPAALQAISYAVPARYFLVVTRGIFLKGVGVDVLWVQGLLMVLFAVVGQPFNQYWGCLLAPLLALAAARCPWRMRDLIAAARGVATTKPSRQGISPAR